MPAAMKTALGYIVQSRATGDESGCVLAKRALIESAGVIDGFTAYKILIGRPDH